ncbi:Methyltransferase [Heracleum sosnowskyi]|uniref:Methyltransferase n=1 Tax=Heracleum sosnowskyi TaxID=360622 RepID=A0AAD8GW11_9APIA|nr:Methyltransferase [Heracleum sosnowskyi]
MKAVNNGVDLLKSHACLKTSVIFFISLTFFYIGKHWSQYNGDQNLIFFTTQSLLYPSKVILSPNLNKLFDLSTIFNDTSNSQTLAPISPLLDAFPPSQAAEMVEVERMGVLDETGAMKDEFSVGEFDPELVDNLSSGNESDVRVFGGRARVKRLKLCDRSMSEYIPCLDNVEVIKRLKSKKKGERFERHCPEKSLSCIVPTPIGYTTPIPWPTSRDEVWFSNVPHARLAEAKGGQNWILVDKNKFKFPGGGTQFIHGADQYLDQISKMVPDITFGGRTRVALDIGCGVASFGAYLLSRNVLTMSVAPKDVHENQIQFALERGVPAMVAAFATRRLLYPSQAFDLIHCSRCRINWTRDDGILLLEINRMLRGGGYFVWAAQPVYKHKPALEEQWEEMINLTTRLCWNLVKKKGYIAIWQKPVNNNCYLSREHGTQPPLCEPDDDPDNVWYVDLKACISRLPEAGYGTKVTKWPARLYDPPDRLQSIQIDAYLSRKELFKAEFNYWNETIASNVRVLHWKNFKLRNVLDMRAGYGGFAAALLENNLDCWVMNVVPVSGPNTLPVIYDRGLLGVMHDWCEPFDTYPRTYDFLHAAGLFSIERKRCNISSIMLEMDRILRPGGRVYIRDSLSLMDELQAIGRTVGWDVAVRDTYEGRYESYRIMVGKKHMLK